MGELTKMWHTKKNARVNRVELCKQTMRKLRATKNVFKVERCGSSLLTSNRKLNLEQNCWFLNEIASENAVKVVANGVYTATLKTKITYEGGRESD